MEVDQEVLATSKSNTSVDMNTSIHLAKRPKEKIIPGETFEVRRTPVPGKEDVKDGHALIKTEYLSVDPGIPAAHVLNLVIYTNDFSNEGLVE